METTIQHMGMLPAPRELMPSEPCRKAAKLHVEQAVRKLLSGAGPNNGSLQNSQQAKDEDTS